MPLTVVLLCQELKVNQEQIYRPKISLIVHCLMAYLQKSPSVPSRYMCQIMYKALEIHFSWPYQTQLFFRILGFPLVSILRCLTNFVPQDQYIFLKSSSSLSRQTIFGYQISSDICPSPIRLFSGCLVPTTILPWPTDQQE